MKEERSDQNKQSISRRTSAVQRYVFDRLLKIAAVKGEVVKYVLCLKKILM
jgi:Trm5-related predicted tRNA methylase